MADVLRSLGGIVINMKQHSWNWKSDPYNQIGETDLLLLDLQSLQLHTLK